jgi:hypothetical protein
MGDNAQELIEMDQEREVPKPPSGSSLEDTLADNLKAQLRPQLEGQRRTIKSQKKYLNF